MDKTRLRKDVITPIKPLYCMMALFFGVPAMLIGYKRTSAIIYIIGFIFASIGDSGLAVSLLLRFG